MDTPLNASATSAGALFSGNTFIVPPYQREYAWEADEVQEFWEDLKGGLEEGTYFLGLLILTNEGSDEERQEGRKHVVDGQQRILTTTLLAAAIYHEAVRVGRKALADRIRSDFLTSMDYQTDDVSPRAILSDQRDDRTLQALISDEEPPSLSDGDADLARRLVQASSDLRSYLADDLLPDPFKRLGLWADYLTNQVYVAVFVHPDPSSAYRVFEVINTRGRELTTADLLKNFVLSQTAPGHRDERYREWQEIARPLSPQSGTSSLVQFIRHVVTLGSGHVAPRDLFAFLAERRPGHEKRRPPSTPELMASLRERLPLYLQMIDPTLDGPAEPSWLGIFTAFQDLGVITVRPLLMAIADADRPTDGMERVLRLVLRRIVVGNLGTGSVERRFSEAARRVAVTGSWAHTLEDLQDLDPSSEEFVEQLRKRSLNKATLAFVHRSIDQSTVTPAPFGSLHLVRPRQATDWEGFPDEDFSYWGSTIGNSVLADESRRPKGAATWEGFRANLLPHILREQDRAFLRSADVWDTRVVEERGHELADEAARVWYGGGE